MFADNIILDTRSLFPPLSARSARNIPCVQHTTDVTRLSASERSAKWLRFCLLNSNLLSAEVQGFHIHFCDDGGI